jgi:hypothetical protein
VDQGALAEYVVKMLCVSGVWSLCQEETEYWEFESAKKTTQLGVEQKIVDAYCRGVMAWTKGRQTEVSELSPATPYNLFSHLEEISDIAVYKCYNHMTSNLRCPDKIRFTATVAFILGDLTRSLS